MKKLIVILFLVFSAKTSQAQILMALIFGDKLNSDKLEFGMSFGNSFSTMTNIEDSKWRLGGFNFGLFFNIKLADDWYLHTGAIPKTTLGLRSLPVYPTGNLDIDTLVINNFGFCVKRNLNYINVPILPRYRLWKDLYLQGGPVITLRTKANDEFSTEEEPGDLIYNRNLNDDLKRIDVGVSAGVVYKIKKIGEVSASFNQGLIDMDKRIDDANRAQYVMLNFNVIVGAKKAAKEKEAEAGTAPGTEPKINISSSEINVPGITIPSPAPDKKEKRKEKKNKE